MHIPTHFGRGENPRIFSCKQNGILHPKPSLASGGRAIFRGFEMQFTTVLSLLGAGVASAAFAWQRQWTMSLAWLFSLAYTVFDKVFPAVLPEPLVTSFSFLFLALVLLFCWQSFSRKRAR
jgi:hypothetical protein